MPKPDLCEIVVVLDRSGSMQSIATDMVGGFDTFLADQRKQPGECRVTLVQFDTGAIETVYEARALADVPRLALEPRGGTPLLDAMGKTITRVGERYHRLAEAERPGAVLFLVITDGEENSSTRYKRPEIKRMVEHQTEVYKWTFAYLGANVDAFAEARALGITLSNAAPYAPSAGGVRHAFVAASANTSRLRGGASYGYTADERAKTAEELSKLGVTTPTAPPIPATTTATPAATPATPAATLTP